MIRVCRGGREFLDSARLFLTVRILIGTIFKRKVVSLDRNTRLVLETGNVAGDAN
ncbi:hypothetical protein V5E97_33335 [Singulisphaera sp. Ch08]|uniref:Uncharacterized protein n=1 Tax=Singulisphaera sp. Ch08 TaxID=3120278 RepID=A0AAU7CCX0_9BACT